MAIRHRRVFAALLFLLAGLGCQEEEQSAADSGQYPFTVAGGEALDLSRESRIEGDEFLLKRRPEAARESHLRAYQYAEEALAAQSDAEGRAEVLDYLADLAIDIGKHHRAADYLGRAVRHANERLRGNPRLFRPQVFKGAAYGISGMLVPAQQVFEGLLALDIDPGPAELVKRNLIAVYYGIAKRLLLEDAVGARALAWKALARAWALLPDAGLNSDVESLMAQLRSHYADEANSNKDDPLALARIHSRYGLSDPLGAENLAKAIKEHGRTTTVRWVEARYVEEMDGRPEMLEKAAEHYLQLMSREDKAPFAAAGLGRVLLELGRPEEALPRLESFSETTGELKRVMVLLRLARIEGLGADEDEKEAVEFEKIEVLLSGELGRDLRARLLTRVGMTAILRKNRERLDWVIREFRRRIDGDPRIYVLDAELEGLKAAEGDE